MHTLIIPELLPYGAPSTWDRGYFDALLGEAEKKAQLAGNAHLPDSVLQIMADASEQALEDAKRYALAFGNPVGFSAEDLKGVI